MEPGDDHYDVRVTVLGEYIDHHVKEEEGEIFVKARKADVDTEALGEQMSDRKEALMVELGFADEDSPRPPPVKTASPSRTARGKRR
jgi:hypothetical protein